MNVEELKQKALAATPGPWEYTNDSKDFPVNGYVTVRDCIYSVCVLPYEGIRADDRVTDNGRFIAVANPAALLELIAERDELAATLDRAQAEIRALESKLLDATAKPIRICESCAIYPCKCE